MPRRLSAADESLAARDGSNRSGCGLSARSRREGGLHADCAERACRSVLGVDAVRHRAGGTEARRPWCTLSCTEFSREAVIKPGLFALLLCIPLYYVFWKAIFGSREAFLDALRYWFQPNWLSFLRGEFNRDLYVSFKLGFYIVLCSACTALVIHLVT